MSNPLLELQQVSAGYGEIQVLKDVSLQVNKGETVVLLGGNGAGKTTTLRCISGLVAAKKGKILLDGEEIQNLPGHLVTRRGIAHIPEGRCVFPQLSVEENLIIGAYTKPKIPEQIYEDVFEMFPILKARRKQMAGSLSGGEQQMLAIARGLMLEPKLLMLDEPSLGLAPLVVDSIFETIQFLNSQGSTILLVEQNVHESIEIAHRYYILESGTIISNGEAKQLIEDQVLKEAYLGI